MTNWERWTKSMKFFFVFLSRQTIISMVVYYKQTSFRVMKSWINFLRPAAVPVFLVKPSLFEKFRRFFFKNAFSKKACFSRALDSKWAIILNIRLALEHWKILTHGIFDNIWWKVSFAYFIISNVGSLCTFDYPHLLLRTKQSRSDQFWKD